MNPAELDPLQALYRAMPQETHAAIRGLLEEFRVRPDGFPAALALLFESHVRFVEESSRRTETLALELGRDHAELRGILQAWNVALTDETKKEFLAQIRASLAALNFAEVLRDVTEARKEMSGLHAELLNSSHAIYTAAFCAQQQNDHLFHQARLFRSWGWGLALLAAFLVGLVLGKIW